MTKGFLRLREGLIADATTPLANTRAYLFSRVTSFGDLAFRSRFGQAAAPALAAAKRSDDARFLYEDSGPALRSDLRLGAVESVHPRTSNPHQLLLAPLLVHPLQAAAMSYESLHTSATRLHESLCVEMRWPVMASPALAAVNPGMRRHPESTRPLRDAADHSVFSVGCTKACIVPAGPCKPCDTGEEDFGKKDPNISRM